MIENPLLVNKSDIKSKVLGEQIINLLDKTFVIPNKFEYSTMEITEDFVARMDLVSKYIYGTEKYQDLLCKLNGISNPFELNEGTIIIIPEYEYLPDFYFFEKNSDKEQENTENTTVPKAKKKKEKRKPNEAIIGDKRFKIDTSRKVIVY